MILVEDVEMEPRWKELLPQLIDRHRVVDIERYPWFRRAARVRIAIYAEGSIRFDGGPFAGLQRVIAALNADPWPWVKFEVTLIHRTVDPSADLQNKRLDDIELEDFDELWLFGISSGNALSAQETAAVEAFIDGGGGVLHTGDHASLGQGIAGSIKRVGAMRQYPAPAASPTVWNNTLRPGADGLYQFADQSDDVPQAIRLRYYHAWTFVPLLRRNKYPHPVLCGKSGPIRIFPDHQHEGEAVAPGTYPAATWPSKNGFQPKVEVVAWGRIQSPDADQGREVGLVSTYNGHAANVGRIVADSTWHHWFDINLDGFAATAAGQARLKTIEEYFLNVAAWLAPKSKQSQMRNGIIVFSLWRDPLVMLEPKTMPLYFLGGMARDALGQFAPQCMVRQWIIDIIPPLLIEDIPILIPDPGPLADLTIPMPIEDIVLAGIVQPLVEANLRAGIPEKGVTDDAVDEAVAQALPRAAKVLKAQIGALKQLEKLPERLVAGDR
jgi:hypothetical protein